MSDYIPQKTFQSNKSPLSLSEVIYVIKTDPRWQIYPTNDYTDCQIVLLYLHSLSTLTVWSYVQIECLICHRALAYRKTVAPLVRNQWRYRSVEVSHQHNSTHGNIFPICIDLRSDSNDLNWTVFSRIYCHMAYCYYADVIYIYVLITRYLNISIIRYLIKYCIARVTETIWK